MFFSLLPHEPLIVNVRRTTRQDMVGEDGWLGQRIIVKEKPFLSLVFLHRRAKPFLPHARCARAAERKRETAPPHSVRRLIGFGDVPTLKVASVPPPD